MKTIISTDSWTMKTRWGYYDENDHLLEYASGDDLSELAQELGVPEGFLRANIQAFENLRDNIHEDLVDLWKEVKS